MRRLAVFYFNDNSGTVDEYIQYLLNDVLKNIDDLYIVCNEILSEEGRKIFQNYTNNIVVIGNIGCDGEAYQHILVNYIDIEKLEKYDELVLINDSFYGPFYPLVNIFEEMSSKENDYWGLLSCGKKSELENRVDEYIKTYFVVIRSKMLHSSNFRQFWNELYLDEEENEYLSNFEVKFTNYFKCLGYRKESFVNPVAYENSNGLQPCDWSIHMANRLIQEYRFPILRKDALLVGVEVDKKAILRSISEIYNVDLIWDNLVRTTNVQQIIDSLGLYYILDNDTKKVQSIKRRTALFIHVYYQDLIGEIYRYITHVPKEIDIYISTSNENYYNNMKSKFKDKVNIENISLIPNRGRDVAALVVYFKPIILQYEVFGFIHDKKSVKGTEAFIGEIFRYNLFSNLLYGNGYIHNILDLMEREKKIGLVVPPVIYTKECTELLVNGWFINYNNVKNLLTRINIDNKNLKFEFAPIAYGTAFWAKTDALRPLFDMDLTYEDFCVEPFPPDGEMSHAIERVLPYIAQSRGYATGVIENIVSAANRIRNYETKIKNVVKKSILNPKSIKVLREYIVKNNKCYMYGCGAIANTVYRELKSINVDIDGFIVTKIGNQSRLMFGLEVFEIGEIQLKANHGIILALNDKKAKEVEKILIDKGIINYFKL